MILSHPNIMDIPSARYVFRMAMVKTAWLYNRFPSKSVDGACLLSREQEMITLFCRLTSMRQQNNRIIAHLKEKAVGTEDNLAFLTSSYPHPPGSQSSCLQCLRHCSLIILSLFLHDKSSMSFNLGNDVYSSNTNYKVKQVRSYPVKLLVVVVAKART